MKDEQFQTLYNYVGFGLLFTVANFILLIVLVLDLEVLP